LPWFKDIIDSSASETFLTLGGAIELSSFRLSATFMDSESLSDDPAGRQFVNVAVGYVMR
jgi:hypothetical protein